MNFKFFLLERRFLVFKTDFLYHQKYTSLYYFFMATKVNR